MTVLEIDAPPQPILVLPFDSNRADSLEAATPLLQSPNINELPDTHQPRALCFLNDMSMALASRQIEEFNEAKRQLLQLIRKYGTPITQWNPLTLVLVDALCLQEAQLPQINLDMVRLLAVNEERVSFNGAKLQGAGFLCADLTGVSFDDADLSSADFRFADLRESSLQRASLVEADLSNAKLSFANLDEASLYCAKLNGSLVKEASLQHVNLRKADLRHADFYQANLSQARLQQSDLREANLFMANLTEAKLRHVDLRKANLGFCCLKQARLINASFVGANFASADLSEADFQGGRFTGVVLSRSILRATNLTSADLQGVDLSECIDLEAARLQNAHFDGDTLFPKGFNPKKHALINRHFKGLRRFVRLLPAMFFQNNSVSGPLAN